MDDRWLSLKLPLPDTQAVQTIFYHPISALEIEVTNLPVSDSQESMNQMLTDVFSIFGHIESIQAQDKDKAQIKFQSVKGFERAMMQKQKHERDLPLAVAGKFGVDRYLAKHQENHPDIGTLQRISSEYIAAFEKKESEQKESSGIGKRHVVRLTQAETQALMDKYKAKVKAMQSSDFYAFQQRDKPLLGMAPAKESSEKPFHLKKKPKKRAEPIRKN